MERTSALMNSSIKQSHNMHLFVITNFTVFYYFLLKKKNNLYLEYFNENKMLMQFIVRTDISIALHPHWVGYKSVEKKYYQNRKSI